MSGTEYLLPQPLQRYSVPGVPTWVCYVPAFIQPSTSESLLARIESTPSQTWTTLSHRRLLPLPSPLTGKARDTLVSLSPLPSYLRDGIIPKIQELGIFANSSHGSPNHVLVNEYQPGQGIMPHEDGPTYYPITATISLGSATVLDIYLKSVTEGNRGEQQHWRILQEPGSLLVTIGECYKNTLHGIAEVNVDEPIGNENIANWGLLGDRGRYLSGANVRETRVSLTYRDVKKVMKCGSNPSKR